jgi:hypothetical protein
MADEIDPEDEAVAAVPSEAELADRRAHELLLAAYASDSADVFSNGPAEALAIEKSAADKLVRLKLAWFPDESRDTIKVTNSGRYWALNGGYMAFLKEDPPTGGGGTRGRNPEMEALRFTYMKLRLNTFWLTFGMSIAGFLISLVSLAVAYFYGERLMLR